MILKMECLVAPLYYALEQVTPLGGQTLGSMILKKKHCLVELICADCGWPIIPLGSAVLTELAVLHMKRQNIHDH